MKKYLHQIVIGIIILFVAVLIYLLIILSRNGFGPGAGDYSYRINENCFLSKTSAHMVTVGCNDIEKSTEPEVIKLGWNDNFIIVTTNPISETQNEYSVKQSINYWWIFDLKNKILYGPLDSEAAYNSKRSELNIGNLELLPIETAKKKAYQVD